MPHILRHKKIQTFVSSFDILAGNNNWHLLPMVWLALLSSSWTSLSSAEDWLHCKLVLFEFSIVFVRNPSISLMFVIRLEHSNVVHSSNNLNSLYNATACSHSYLLLCVALYFFFLMRFINIISVWV